MIVFNLWIQIGVKSIILFKSNINKIVISKIFLLTYFVFLSLNSNLFSYDKKFRYRKYTHVKTFYERISFSAITLGVKYNVPPSAILAIAGLESGYGRGYVAQITGNILSLGAGKGVSELPALFLPVHVASGKVLFDTTEVQKYKQDEIKWKQRPASLKKDYRPSNIAGTKNDLTYFKNHYDNLKGANYNCIKDFVTVWISNGHGSPVFNEARVFLDKLVKSNGKEILLDKDIALEFIKMIGGKPRSFNFRETWPKKVVNILNNAGLNELVNKMYQDKKLSFEEVW